MKMSKRVWSVILIWILMLGMYRLTPATEESAAGESAAETKNTIYIWYTDEALTDYISSAALAFYDEENVRVTPVLYTGPDYLEKIYASSVSGNEVADLYVLGTESMEKAAMAGLAVPVQDDAHILSQLRYPQTALDAVTYHQKSFGYPFYFETAFLLYNETYLKQMATSVLWTEMTGKEELPETFELPEGCSRQQWDEKLDRKIQEMIPSTIEDILNFADLYDAPENVENIFLWDVSDIFYNYFFAGAYMDVGGSCGDDDSVIEVYNADTIECLQVYQQLNQFFSIDSSESNYADVLNTFLEGRTIFTIATTDAISKLEQAKENGSFPYTYNVAPLPGTTKEHTAGGLSVTDAVVINGYSSQQANANAFAEYLAYERADTLVARAGKMPAAIGEDDYVTDARDLVRQVYRDSKSLPKAFEFENFWLQLELAYTRIWDGEDVNDTLRTLSETLKMQVSGSRVEEERIEVAPLEITEGD